MADVISHGGDGGSDPPCGPAYTLPGWCETAPPAKRRNISRSQNLEKKWRENGMKPLLIEFDYINGTWQSIGPNQKYCTRLIGNQVRFNVVPYYRDWGKVPKEDRDRVRAMVETYFDVRGERSDHEYKMAISALDRLAGDRYRAYKTDMDPQTKQLPSPIDSFKEFHTFKSSDWVNKNAEVDYDHLCEVRQTQCPSTPINERAIVREVLRTRRGHERGIGRILKGTTTCVDSIDATSLHAPRGSTSTDDSRFAEYDARIRQLEMTIARLTQNAKEVNDDDDDEDGLDGLGD